MINQPRDYDAKQIARLVGEVRLTLPKSIRGELDSGVDRALAMLPGGASQELKDIMAAQFALTLRGLNFGGILEKEFEKQRTAEGTRHETADFERLDLLRRKYSEICLRFEGVAYNRRSSVKVLNAEFKWLLREIELFDDLEAVPLRAWASQLFRKRLALAGAAPILPQ